MCKACRGHLSKMYLHNSLKVLQITSCESILLMYSRNFASIYNPYLPWTLKSIYYWFPCYGYSSQNKHKFYFCISSWFFQNSSFKIYFISIGSQNTRKIVRNSDLCLLYLTNKIKIVKLQKRSKFCLMALLVLKAGIK